MRANDRRKLASHKAILIRLRGVSPVAQVAVVQAAVALTTGFVPFLALLFRLLLVNLTVGTIRHQQTVTSDT